MRRVVTRAAALLVVYAAAAITVHAAHVPPERLIVPGQRVGPVEIGMTRAAATVAVERAGIAGAPTVRELGDAVEVSFTLDPDRFPRGEDRAAQVLAARFLRGLDRVLNVTVEARGRAGMQTEQNVAGGTSLLNAARVYRPRVIKTELAYGARLITEFRDVGIGFVSRAGSQTILDLFVFEPDAAPRELR